MAPLERVEVYRAGLYDVEREADFTGYQLTWMNGCFAIMPDGARMTWSRTGKTNGTWYHVAAIFDSGTPQVQVDGMRERADAGRSYTTGLKDLLFGSFTEGRRLKTTVDDVRIYERALSQEEIEALASGRADATSEPPEGEQRF